MSLTLRPVAGTKIYVSAVAPATIDAAGYQAIPAADLKELVGPDNMGKLGTNTPAQSYNPIDGAQQFYRTTRTVDAFDLSAPEDATDDGQIACKTAYDAANGTAAETLTLLCRDAAGNETWCRTLVLEFARNFGGSDDLIMRAMRFQPDPSSFVEA